MAECHWKQRRRRRSISKGASRVEHRSIAIRTIRHVETGLLMAMSDDLKGLYVDAGSEADLWERILIAIRAILEADGYNVSRSDMVLRKWQRSTGNVDPL